MCGIFGILSHQGEAVPDDRFLKQTANLLQHRGPDGFGIYSEYNVGLVHTRLSLLDLSDRSNQPFWDKQQRYCLLYNGEIYNFKELRAGLEQKGVQFRTTSDTEVLLEYLLNRGIEETLPKLEGMFAFALYDKTEKTLVLARDRFGIKPLFIYDGKEAFIFASEIRAMQPWVRFEPDVLSISGFLYGFSGPTRGFTFYKAIKFLDPGGVVKIRQGERAEYGRFFFLGDFVDQAEMERLQQLDPQQLIDEVDESLNESVRSQLVADAPVGALCSGGIDSSIVMAIAAQYHKDLAVFHANVVGPVSEYGAALRLARHLKLDLKAVEVRDQAFIDEIPEVTEHFGHPFYPCPHSIPYLMVSRLVQRHHVKAVLSGEGADEHFLGYSYISPDARKWLGVGTMRRLLRGLLKPHSDAGKFKYLGPAYVAGGDPHSNFGLVAALHNRFEVVGEALELRARLPNQNGHGDYKSPFASLDALHYNLRSLLHRNDSMGMAASIEGRFPFLDTRLAKLAINMPYNMKIRFSPTALDQNHYLFRDKWILRKVADRYLPRDLSRRMKKPFPINAYAPQRLRIAPAYFDNSFISDLFCISQNEIQCLAKQAKHNLRWKMVLLDVWAHVCLNALPKESILSKLRNHLSITNQNSTVYLR
jgi:asparagine synthase (glutamine-hydrolysing)